MQGKSPRERCTFIAHVSGCLSASDQKVSPMFGRMTKSNGTIRPHSDGKWLLRVSAGRDVLTGKRLQPSRVVSGSFDDAKRQLLHFQLEVMQGDLVNSSPTLDSLFENWLNAPTKNGRSRSSASHSRPVSLGVEALTLENIPQLAPRLVDGPRDRPFGGTQDRRDVLLGATLDTHEDERRAQRFA